MPLPCPTLSNGQASQKPQVPPGPRPSFQPAHAPLIFQGVRGMDGPHGPKGSLVSDWHGHPTQPLAPEFPAKALFPLPPFDLPPALVLALLAVPAEIQFSTLSFFDTILF